jgi:hypothetical protein
MASQNAGSEKTNDVKAKADSDTKTSSAKYENVLLHTSITHYIKNQYLLSLKMQGNSVNLFLCKVYIYLISS